MGIDIPKPLGINELAGAHIKYVLVDDAECVLAHLLHEKNPNIIIQEITLT